MSLFERIIPYFLPKKQIIKTNLIPMSDIEEIYCFSNTAIGDTLFNTPLFRSLKDNFPNKKIVAVLNPTNYALFSNNKDIDEIMLYSGKTKHFFQTLKILKMKKPKLFLLLHSNDPQATSMAVLSGAKYVIKIPNYSNKFNRWHTNKPTKPVEMKHGVFNRLKQLEYLGITETNPKMHLPLKSEAKERITKYFEHNTKKLIGFQIGASTLSRMWFKENWIELGKKLLDKYHDINIVLTGAPNEIKMTKEVQAGINDERVLNLAGRFDIESAAALIGRLDLLITPDTGPLHMAIALQTPTIGFFVVAHHSGSNACYDQDIHLYIQKDKTCTPCVGKDCKFAKCMLQIEVDLVVGKVKEIWEKNI